MFAFVISLVVVIAAVVITLRVAMIHEAEVDKPATPQAERDREPVVQAVVPIPFPAEWGVRAIAPSPLRRIRSAVLLIVIVTLLGALAALLVAAGGAILVSGLRNAVE